MKITKKKVVLLLGMFSIILAAVLEEGSVGRTAWAKDQGGKPFILFADIPVDGRSPEKIAEYKALGFNTSLLTEDYTGNCLDIYRAEHSSTGAAEQERPLTLAYSGYTNGKCVQFSTNLPSDTSLVNFLSNQEGCRILEDGDQRVGWIGMDLAEGVVYLTFQFNHYFDEGDRYVLQEGSVLTFDGVEYTLDSTHTVIFRNEYLASLHNLKEAGLDVWIRNYTNRSDYFDGGLTEVLRNHSGIIDGFYMADEAFENASLLEASGQTQISDFQSLSPLVGWFRTNFPDTYFHMNQVPISSHDHYTGKESTENYKAFLNTYMDTFVKNLDPDAGKTLCFDNYPFVRQQSTSGFWLWQKTTSGIWDAYLKNMLIAAECVKEYNASSENGDIELGICVQTFHATALDGSSSRDITAASEITLQLYTGMALGADLFEYFAYNSGHDVLGIMNQDGTRRIYDLVQEANENALGFADVVNTFEWQGIKTSSGTTSNSNKVGFGLVSDLVLGDEADGVLKSISSTDDAIAGCFQRDEQDGYLVVNYNDPLAVTSDNQITLSFESCTTVRVFTCSNGALQSEIVPLSEGTYTFALAPGNACFVVPA